MLRGHGFGPKLFGRIGHGLGLGTGRTGNEPPSISTLDDRVMDEGMVLTMEPEISTVTLEKPKEAAKIPEFRFCQEEDVLITEDGYEVLSNASRELYII